MAEQWQKQPERSNLFWLHSIRWIALHLGRPVARVILLPITLYFMMFGGPARQASAEYLQRALPHKPTWRDRAKHIHCFASTILDRVFLFSGRTDLFDVEIINRDILDTHLANQQGCLLITSHFGSFEIMRVLGSRSKDMPISILMNKKLNQKLSSVLEALDPKLAAAIIDTSVSEVDLVLNIKKALDNGAFIGLMADRIQDDERSCDCDFLGAPAQFPSNLWLMASLLNNPVVLCFGMYMGKNKYRLEFEVFDLQKPAHRRERLLAAEQNAQLYSQKLAQRVKAAPYNWFNFYRFWH